MSKQLLAPAAFLPCKEPPGTHRTGGRVGPRAGLDAVAKRKNAYTKRKTNPGGDQVTILSEGITTEESENLTKSQRWLQNSRNNEYGIECRSDPAPVAANSQPQAMLHILGQGTRENEACSSKT
jgi:hypothetical protein